MYKLDEEKNIVNKTCVQIRKHENDTWYMEIPESWAEELSEISDVWIIGKGIEKGLNLYSPQQWEKMKLFFLKEKAIDEKRIRVLQRHLMAAAYETRIQNGKINIPEILIAYCEIENEEAVLIKYEREGKVFYSVQNMSEAS
ncbi:MAG TPA: hypothetical protein H9754_10885 [Candidatus Anaerostipes avistercoris]|uniref:Uncharacterized protein n=1 Tax=Candidatus Anaerostipes avistercoris TaxID=2838462 RepID=A0A9D2PLG2_9FIRM|nr:hypothetical protein [Candidatus Anaerostipes avistercoris]